MNVDMCGHILAERGFRDWFLYMFRVINGKPFIVEELHEKLFNKFEDSYNGNAPRICLNMPPRSGKTTLASYFVAYSLAVNPKSNFIYTSYSQELLGTISAGIANILNHPVYKAMYNAGARSSEVKLEPVDQFWKDYLQETKGRELFTSRKIITAQGGVCLFSSMGSAITGFGAGIMGAPGFTGALIIDDGNKPAEVRSETIRTKIKNYFTETLLTRLNNPGVPIINIQQRLHLEDLTGILIRDYNFENLKLPLIDSRGVCTLPAQYNQERLEELQKDDYSFLSQYQQEPIKEGGNLIKLEYFRTYEQEPRQFDRLYIVCDTAFSTKKMADNSVFLLAGLAGGNLYILNVYCKRVGFPDLKRDLKKFYEEARRKYTPQNFLSSIYIENKASGISLIQELRAEGMPITELAPRVASKYNKEVVADKYTRFLEISADLESGYCLIPEIPRAWQSNFIKECLAFDGNDNNGQHDDQVDCLIYALKIRRQSLAPNWEDVTNVFTSY